METQPARIGRYRIVKELDTGGQSRVYVAEFDGSPPGVCYALKLMTGQHDEASKARFSREIAIGVKLQHPNVCRMLDWGIEDDVPYMVMELLEGETLGDRVKRGGPMALDAARDVIVQVLHGLTAIHDFGVVHRDLKPDNIFLTSGGGVKILDFGFSRLHQRPSGLTPSGAFIGTIDFVAPEQMTDARSVDPRCDIFNVGQIFFYLLTGHPPFWADEFGEQLQRLMSGSPTPLSQYRPELPATVQAWLDTCLAVDREQRVPNTRAALKALLL